MPSPAWSAPDRTTPPASSYGGDGGADKRMVIDLAASTDHGATWTTVSTVAAAGNSGGLWEPELHVNAEGQLTVYYCDETDPAHSQKLVEVFSADGVTWSQPYPVVALADAGARPGMAVVRTLRTGTRVLTRSAVRRRLRCLLPHVE